MRRLLTMLVAAVLVAVVVAGVNVWLNHRREQARQAEEKQRAERVEQERQAELAALRRVLEPFQAIHSGLEVGINYETYISQLREAKLALERGAEGKYPQSQDRVSRVFPALKKALEGYQDAAFFWRMEINDTSKTYDEMHGRVWSRRHKIDGQTFWQSYNDTVENFEPLNVLVIKYDLGRLAEPNPEYPKVLAENNYGTWHRRLKMEAARQELWSIAGQAVVSAAQACR